MHAHVRTYQRPQSPSRWTPTPYRASQPQRDRGARPWRPLRDPSRPWAARGSPRDRLPTASRRPRKRRERRGRVAALRAAGGGQCFARVPAAVLTDAGAATPAVGKHAQRPGAAATARGGAALADPAALVSRFAAASRRPERLRGAVSGLSRVRRGIGARLMQCPDGQGCVGES